MFGDSGQRMVRTAGPSLGRRQVCGVEDPFQPELQEGLGALHRRPQGGGVTASQISRVRSRWQGGHGDVDLELLLPLVEPAGG